ncbi:hypothetical protein RMCBS344292_09426 [Rhizopus microsporus]|nr:hypothetical protein RMCBS344292_09426 [Rhizopus microsporus]
MAATEAANQFWQQFKEEQSKIEDLLNESYSLPKSDLSQHFDTILQKINTMEKKITEALDYIPSYDERQFSLQLKSLGDRLEKTKAELTPKAKFSFKSRKKKSSVLKATSTEKEPETDNKEDLLSDATVLLKDESNTILRLDQKTIEKKSIDVLLSNLKNCIVILEDPNITISTVHIKDVQDCVILCGKIDGSVLIYDIKHSLLVVGCHQLRIHDANEVDILMHVTSRPIIEDSTGVTSGKYTIQTDDINYFDQIEDFNWLKKWASPNWTVMSNDRERELNQALKTNMMLTDLPHLLPNKN